MKRAFLLGALILSLLFAWPLWRLCVFAVESSLYSHIPLIPAISIYLCWLPRKPLVFAESSRTAWLFAAASVAALLLLAVGFLGAGAWRLSSTDALACSTLALIAATVGLCGGFFSQQTLREIAPALGFLLFMVPLPQGLLESIQGFLQHGSAFVAGLLFKLTSIPVYHEELSFQLPSISLQVAPECSGIHSSLVLFITSVLAGILYLRSPWKTAILAFSVVPLALLRNGFRIFTLGQLCVRIGPEMIESWIHRNGGPIFFVLSLIPLIALLRVLQRLEQRKQIGASHSKQQPCP